MEPVNARSSELAKLLTNTFDELCAASICYCVLRNYKELPSYTTHDVDMLVECGELEKAVRIVNESIETCGWVTSAEVCQARSHSLYCMIVADGQVQCMTFDIVEDLPWGWMPTCDIKYVLSTKVEFNTIPVVSDGAEAALRLIKELLRGTVPKKYACENIRSGATNEPDKFVRCFSGILPERMIYELLEYARSGKIKELVDKHAYFQRMLILKLHSTRPVDMVTRFIRYRISRIKRFSAGSLGLFVVLLGPDGAGKSALSNRLADRLGQLLFKGAVCYHMQFNMIPKLSNVLRKLTGIRTKQIDFTKKHSGSSVPPHPPWRSLLYVAYYSLDFALGHLRLRREKGLGRLILFDRYFYDFYFQGRNRRLSSVILDCFRHVVPKPDLILLLEADPGAIYSRKPELEQNEIEKQLDKATQLGGELAQSIPVRHIRTDRGVKIAQRDAEYAVFEALALKNGLSVVV